MPSRVALALGLCLALQVQADFPNRSYDCPKDVGAWAGVPAVGAFLVVRDSAPAPKATSFKAAWTPEALRVLVRCEEAQPEKLKAKEPDGGKLWEEDAVELFVARPRGDGYRQFIANAASSRYQGFGRAKVDLGPWTCAASRDGRGYSLEFDIPFAMLGGAPEPGEVWRFNVGRDDTISGDCKFSTWAFIPPGNDFHSVESFGFLRFVEAAAAAAPEAPTAQLVERFHQQRCRDEFDRDFELVSRFLGTLPADWPDGVKFKEELAARRAAFQEVRETASAEDLRGRIDGLDSLRTRLHRSAKRLCLNRLFPSAEALGKAIALVWVEGGRPEAARLLRELSGVPEFRASALLHLGICHQLDGDYQGALELYALTLGYGGFVKARALIRSAECADALGRTADALEFYGEASLMPDISAPNRREAEAGFRGDLNALRACGSLESVKGKAGVLPALKALLFAGLSSDIAVAAAKIAALDAEFPGSVRELEARRWELAGNSARVQGLDLPQALGLMDAMDRFRVEVSLAGKKLFLSRLFPLRARPG